MTGSATAKKRMVIAFGMGKISHEDTACPGRTAQGVTEIFLKVLRDSVAFDLM
jgi:hypothetical protein